MASGRADSHGSSSCTNAHHLIAPALKLVRHSLQRDAITGLVQVLETAVHKPGPLAPERKQRKYPHLQGHATHLMKGGAVERLADRPSRSPSVRANMRQYSSNDRPQGTTWSNVNIGVKHVTREPQECADSLCAEPGGQR